MANVASHHLKSYSKYQSWGKFLIFQNWKKPGFTKEIFVCTFA